MKQPAFQFYVKDWLTNQKLRRCSEAARGAWVDVLCALHSSDEYGVARMPVAELAKLAGVSKRSIRELVDREVLKGKDAGFLGFFHTITHARKRGETVQLLSPSEGPCWYSSRMVKDEWLRGVRGANTRFDEDNQPQRTDRQGAPPSRSPTRRQGEVSGDGAAVAVAVAVDLSTAVVVNNSPASDEPTPTAVGGNPQVNPDFVARMVTELGRAKVNDVDPASPMLERWITQHHATPHHVAQACIEATRAQGAPQPLTMAYLDAIVKRLASTDQRIHDGAQRSHERTQATIAEQQARPDPSPVPDSIREKLGRALKPRDPNDFEALPA